MSLQKILTALIVAATLVATPAMALDKVDAMRIDRMINGGPVSIRDVSKSLYHSRSTDTEVLDVLAEVLLQNYHDESRTNIDAMAWGAKALGASGLNRYRSTLQELINNGHRKLAKHSKKALKQLKSGSDQQYVKGSVSLDKAGKQASAASSKPKAAKRAAPKKSASGEVALSSIEKGMSMQEVYALLGQPTATHNYQTGKAFIPFNYKGADTVRMAALYKGQGRVVFSNESHYSSGWRVLEVIENPNESGYP